MVKVRKGKAFGLKSVLKYIQNPEKTDGGLLVSAKDCLLENAFNEMMLTKNQYHKTSGRQYVHIIQAFSVDDPVTPEMAHEIGQKMLNNFKGYEGVVCTHVDKRHIHNHIVLNSVNHETGQKWQMSATDLRKLKDYSDELCLEKGLSVIKTNNHWRSKYETERAECGNSWKNNLSKAIAHCIQSCTTRKELVVELESHGIGVEFRDDKLMFTTPWKGLKCGSDKLLPYGDFTKENIERYLVFNLSFFDRNYPLNQILGCMQHITNDISQEKPNESWYTKPLSELEGQALKEALIKLKLGKGYDWEIPTQQTNSENNTFLVNIDNLFTLMYEVRETINVQNAYKARKLEEQKFHNNYLDEEDEYELY